MIHADFKVVNEHTAVCVCSGSDQKVAVVEWLLWLIDHAEHFEQ